MRELRNGRPNLRSIKILSLRRNNSRLGFKTRFLAVLAFVFLIGCENKAAVQEAIEKEKLAELALIENAVACTEKGAEFGIGIGCEVFRGRGGLRFEFTSETPQFKCRYWEKTYGDGYSASCELTEGVLVTQGGVETDSDLKYLHRGICANSYSDCELTQKGRTWSERGDWEGVWRALEEGKTCSATWSSDTGALVRGRTTEVHNIQWCFEDGSCFSEDWATLKNVLWYWVDHPREGRIKVRKERLRNFDCS